MVDKYKLMSGILFTALWIQLCWGFVCTDLITALEPTRSYVNMLCDLVYVVLGVSTIKNRRDTIVLVSFFAIGGLSAFVNHQGCKIGRASCRERVSNCV